MVGSECIKHFFALQRKVESNVGFSCVRESSYVVDLKKRSQTVQTVAYINVQLLFFVNKLSWIFMTGGVEGGLTLVLLLHRIAIFVVLMPMVIKYPRPIQVRTGCFAVNLAATLRDGWERLSSLWLLEPLVIHSLGCEMQEEVKIDGSFSALLSTACSTNVNVIIHP